jgi:exosortase A-associated hydrolase 1/exosortase A-associated hydrolase 2
MPKAFRPLFIPTPGGAAFALLHEPPDRAPHTLALHAHAFAEEMNKSRRMVARQAERLAAQGAAVLIVDLPGCGDSAGELADTGWLQWLDTVCAAAAWLRARHGATLPLWLWGHRAGTLLAVQAAAQLAAADTPCHLLLWQPVPTGRVALQQFLRLKMAAGLQAGGGDVRSVTEQLRAALARREAVEIAGYRLPAAVADGLAAATLAPPAGVATGRLVWLEVASVGAAGEPPSLLPAAAAPLAAFEAAGWQVQAQAVAGPMFWQTAEIEDAPALIEATAGALSSSGASTPARAPSVRALNDTTAVPVADGCVEEPVAFSCDGETLLGLISRPAASPPKDTGVLIVVGGPQYRAGSHRQFVQLARALAAQGHSVLRFDVRGMGDSSGAQRSFEALSDDVAAAVDMLAQREPTVRRIVLWGLCDGASASLIYLDRQPDPRVHGLVLLNPWVRSDASLARTQVKHYYRERLLQPEFWRKLLRGGVAWQALRGLVSNLRRAAGSHAGQGAAGLAAYQDRMARAWRRFTGPSLLVLSGRDYTAREFVEYTAAAPAWQGLRERPSVQTIEPAEADHTFSSVAEQRALEAATLRWLAAIDAAPR